jgi:dihydrofolate reductase
MHGQVDRQEEGREPIMGKVISNMSMSLDGFIEDANGSVEQVFEWYTAGPVKTESANENLEFNQSEEDAAFLQEEMAGIGALIAGRKLFDVADGWQGTHPVGAPVVVVTHRIPTVEEWGFDRTNTSFVTEGIEAALAKAQQLAGDKVVMVASPTITQQLLDLGLLDVITVDLAPVVLGSGTPYLANLASAPVRLGNPRIVRGNRVTHLRYDVIR